MGGDTTAHGHHGGNDDPTGAGAGRDLESRYQENPLQSVGVNTDGFSEYEGNNDEYVDYDDPEEQQKPRRVSGDYCGEELICFKEKF